MSTADEHMAAIDAQMRLHFPHWPPLTDADKAAIVASVAAAPPMSERQARRVGRLLFGALASEEATA